LLMIHNHDETASQQSVLRSCW